MAKVYILVEVTYDYYRFQFNEAVSLFDDFDDSDLMYPLLRYEEGDPINGQLDGDETCHYWVQKMEA